MSLNALVQLLMIPVISVLVVGDLRDRHPREQVRDHLQPGTSAMFMAIEQAAPDKAIAAISSEQDERGTA